MDQQKKIIRDIFEVNKNGKVCVKIALERIHCKLPNLSDTKKSKLLKKCFGDCLKRMRPGRCKKHPKTEWMYYGIQLATTVDELIPESWAQPLQESSPMLVGLHHIIEHLSTPAEITNLREENAALKRELEEVRKTGRDALRRVVKQRDALERNTGRPKRPVIPACMFLEKEQLPLGENIGAGTYGACYMSTFKGMAVAVKISRNPEKLSTERIRESVLQEASDILNLQASQHLPHLIGVCVNKTPFCLVTQYWGSSTIRQALRDKRLLGCIPWVKVVQQVADGLHAIHRSDIVHNDLKGML